MMFAAHFLYQVDSGAGVDKLARKSCSIEKWGSAYWFLAINTSKLRLIWENFTFFNIVFMLLYVDYYNIKHTYVTGWLYLKDTNLTWHFKTNIWRGIFDGQQLVLLINIILKRNILFYIYTCTLFNFTVNNIN